VRRQRTGEVRLIGVRGQALCTGYVDPANRPSQSPLRIDRARQVRCLTPIQPLRYDAKQNLTQIQAAGGDHAFPGGPHNLRQSGQETAFWTRQPDRSYQQKVTQTSTMAFVNTNHTLDGAGNTTLAIFRSFFGRHSLTQRTVAVVLTSFAYDDETDWCRNRSLGNPIRTFYERGGQSHFDRDAPVHTSTVTYSHSRNNLLIGVFDPATDRSGGHARFAIPPTTIRVGKPHQHTDAEGRRTTTYSLLCNEPW